MKTKTTIVSWGIIIGLLILSYYIGTTYDIDSITDASIGIKLRIFITTMIGIVTLLVSGVIIFTLNIYRIRIMEWLNRTKIYVN